MTILAKALIRCESERDKLRADNNRLRGAIDMLAKHDVTNRRGLETTCPECWGKGKHRNGCKWEALIAPASIDGAKG